MDVYVYMYLKREIEDELIQTGVKYQIFEDYFSCPFKSSNNLTVIIKIFADNKDWLNIVTNLGKLDSLKIENNYKFLFNILRINSLICGPKFSIDKNSNIICKSELFQETLNAKILKKMMLQMVQAITFFFEKIGTE